MDSSFLVGRAATSSGVSAIQKSRSTASIVVSSFVLAESMVKTRILNGSSSVASSALITAAPRRVASSPIRAIIQPSLFLAARFILPMVSIPVIALYSYSTARSLEFWRD